MGSKQKTNRTGTYLTFTLAGEDHGIGILRVKEIIGMMPITAIPRTPAYVKGVINLRGKVIPVMDLRLKFGMEKTDYTERTCIIVVEADTTESGRVTGIVVDSVSEVISIHPDDVEDSPCFGTELDTGYILGMARIEGGIKILLDIDQVVGTQHLKNNQKNITQ